ncbi:MAG: TPM domain-containing protein [Candidatus Caenarcaniphilales bacterium]|jgi:uncharacterized membrane protein|nr:TPM domain-containing protein [Candidatus Caenarcaniphilales bacterium]
MSKDFLSKEELHEISSCISLAELNSSAEIRVHIENKCAKEPLTRAKEVFTNLKMNKTKDRNGVLLYIAHQDKKFAIFGDQGIHEKLGDQFWQEEKDLLKSYFSQSQFKEGINQAINKVAEKLTLYFPRQSNDSNELSNEVSIENN